MNEYELTKVSRDSKGLPNYFCEYDAGFLNPIDFVNYEFNIFFKKKLSRIKGELLLSALSANKDLIGGFGIIVDDDYVVGVGYQTDSILECDEKFIDYLGGYVGSKVKRL